jgi:hypothetical protein
MNHKVKAVILLLLDPRSLILALSIVNYIVVWHEASNVSRGGVVQPWYFPWSHFNEPTLLLVAAFFLRLNRGWASGVSCILSAYLLGYVIWLFAVYPDGFMGALRYQWTYFQKYEPFVGSWESQYLFATVIFSCGIFYLTRGIVRRKALRRTADNKALQMTAR